MDSFYPDHGARHRAWYYDEGAVEAMNILHPFPVFDIDDWSKERIELETAWLLCSHPRGFASAGNGFIRRLEVCRSCGMPRPADLPQNACTHVTVWLDHEHDPHGYTVELVTHPLIRLTAPRSSMVRPPARLV